MPPPSLDKSIDKPAARPLTARSKRAPMPQVRAHDHPAEPPKSQADAPKSQVKATYNDSDEDIGSDDNIDYDSGEDSDIITNEIDDSVKYESHSGQFFRRKRWACSECVRLSFLIEKYTIEKCNLEFIMILKKQLRKQLRDRSKYRVAID